MEIPELVCGEIINFVSHSDVQGRHFLRTNSKRGANLEAKGFESRKVERDVRDVHSELVTTFFSALWYSSLLIFVEK